MMTERLSSGFLITELGPLKLVLQEAEGTTGGNGVGLPEEERIGVLDIYIGGDRKMGK